MITVLSCITIQHDLTLVVLAAILCAFGSWVTSRLYRHGRNRAQRLALPWLLLAALTAGVSIWCTHFVAMLGFRPNVPVNFDLALTFLSLVIAVIGCTAGILASAISSTRFAPAIGGAILGLAISGMHYAGMIAYRVQGIVMWDKGYLVASIVLAVIFSAVALVYGNRSARRSEYQMTGILTVAIVSLHFTGMTAFNVAPLDISGDYVNAEAFKTLALAIAGTALLIVMGGLFSYIIENRARMESIAELTAARNAAENASRAKSEFLSVLSHELRTPLTIVLGYAGILSRLRDSTPAHIADDTTDVRADALGKQAELYGRKITVSANHLLTLINEILDYTSIELGDTKLNKNSFAVQELLAEVEDQFQGLANDRQASLYVSGDEFIAFADRKRFKQILINLVGNALKFSKATEICLRAQLKANGFAIEVADNGCGIDDEDLERIFEAFQQLEKAENRSEGGTGLGLAICRKLAVAHGGEISVKSRIGSGSTFTLFMPADAIDRKATKSARQGFPKEMRLAG